MIDDVSLWAGIFLAALLLATSFIWQPLDFWLLFPISLLILTFYAKLFVTFELRMFSKKEWLYSLSSGLILYLLFACGKWLITFLNLPLIDSLVRLYHTVQPEGFFQYVLLFLIVIPGEEWFWRGFVVKRLLAKWTNLQAAFIGTLLYAGIHLFSGSALLVIAAFLAGLCWSYLYVKTRNLAVVIVSHLIFDLFLLIIFPLI
ncbi:CPBP family intramembrane glutamic endopeptidase [Halalkalibacter urbisdiaboli]|uniref:CPBP family intramembrane glutamic endopeptidase n=1 Tax=Halalkalibacter urbisdiaboli TaxID=1960589 RepID=UPI000B45524F|nr:CPBP family intramembrane glutamic endopeptidase [Halalkalibacter urbisdiaboli]